MDTKPTYEQAQLHLNVYDLRREEKLRNARDWFQQNYKADTLEEALALLKPGTESQKHAGKVISYWEQACALVNYGLLHEGLFFETSREFFMVWEQVRVTLPQLREKFDDKYMLSNMEQTAQRYEAWEEKRNPGSIAKMREFMKQERAQAAGS